MESNSQLKGCESSLMPGWHQGGKSGSFVVVLSPMGTPAPSFFAHGSLSQLGHGIQNFRHW